jgi:very-short-patch-repair endonuclease
LHHDEPDNAEYDEERTLYVGAKGWRVLRFSNREVASDIDSVLERITEACNPHPNPSPNLGEGL